MSCRRKTVVQAGVSGELGETRLPLSYSPAISPLLHHLFPSLSSAGPRDRAEERIENATQQVQKSAYQRERRFSSHPRSLQFRMLVIQVKTAVKSEAWRLCAHIKPHHSSNHSLAHSSLAIQAGSQTRWHHHFCLYRL